MKPRPRSAKKSKAPKSDTVIVSLSLPRTLLDDLDAFALDNGGGTRSAMVKIAISQLLKRGVRMPSQDQQ